MTNFVSLPIILLIIVFVAIAVRRIGRIHLPIWMVMCAAAMIVLVGGDISFKAALQSIDFDVIAYLFGVFIIGYALESSHYLERISISLFRHQRNLYGLVAIIILVFAVSSVFLMNDTVAIIGTPVVLMLADRLKVNKKLMLLVLAYSITLGSVMSPVGNPQNLLIANQITGNTFIVFFKSMVVPTMINLVILFVFIWFFYRREFSLRFEPIVIRNQVDQKLARLSKVSLMLLLCLIMTSIVLAAVGVDYHYDLWVIAIVSALPILIFSQKRFSIIKGIDWRTLLFFVGLFVFMKSVWLTGFFQHLISHFGISVTSKSSVLSISVLLSQLISNVPLVALYLPLLPHADQNLHLILAAGSTVAGNLLILGAASNVIIIQNAEKRGGKSFSFWDFFKVGFPLTVCNLIVYYLFI